MPTTGNMVLAGETGIVRRTAPAGLFRGRAAKDFIFMILLPTSATRGVWHVAAPERRVRRIGSRRLMDIEFMREPVDRLDGFFHHPLDAGHFF
jgi:hypothetical protein